MFRMSGGNWEQVTRAVAIASFCFGFLAMLVAGSNAPRIYAAETCSANSCCNWYPPTWSATDSFLSRSGSTRTCFDGETYGQYGRTAGQVTGGSPLAQIRVKNDAWEEKDGGYCGNTFTADSNWVYNQYNVEKYNGYRYIQCTGATSHYYVSKSTHYFGSSSSSYSTALTGNK